MSSTTHVIEIKFISTGANTVTKPLTDIGKGTTELNKTQTTLNKTTASAAPIFAKTSQAYGKTALSQNTMLASSSDLTKTLPKMSTESTKTATSVEKVGTSTAKAGTGLQSFAQKFQGNKGAIFGLVGMTAAGFEAVGMFSMYQSAADKLSAAQQKVNELQALGQEGSAAYKDAVNEVQDAQRGYNFILRNTMLSFTDLIPFTLLFINTLLKNKATLDTAKASTDALATSTKALGMAGWTQFTPTLSNFTKELTKNKTATDLARESMDGMRANFAKFTAPLKSAKTAITNFFTGLLTQFTELRTQGFTKTQAASEVFSGVLTKGLKGIGAGFKAAGTIVLDFGKKLLTVFLSNPILAIITAITVAISALVFDLGGFRTRLNEVGIAIGKAVPALKPFLDILGQIGDMLGKAGDWIMGLAGLKKGIDETGAAAQKALNDIDPFLLGLQKVLDVGQDFENLKTVSDNLSKIKIAIKDVTIETNSWTGTTKTGLTDVGNAFETFSADVITDNEKVRAAMQNFRTVLHDVETGTYDTETAQKLLSAALFKVEQEIARSMKTESAKIKTTQGIVTVTTKYADQLALLNIELKSSTTTFGTLGTKMTEMRKKVGDFIADNESAYRVTDAFKLSLLGLGDGLDVLGTKIVQNKDDTINLAATYQAIIKEQEDLQKIGTKTWNDLSALVTKHGKVALPYIELAIKDISARFPKLGEIVQKLYDEWRDDNEKLLEQYGLLEDKEEKQKTALEKTNEALQQKWETLGILSKREDFTIEQQKQLVSIYESEKKEVDKTKVSLGLLAKERGASDQVLAGSTKTLTDHIMANELAVVSEDEVRLALAKLKDQRDQDVRSNELQTQAATQYLQTLDGTIPVLDMSAEGIQTLIDLRLEEIDAIQIAADRVGTWYAELQASQKIEDQELIKLQGLADYFGIEIPKSISDKGIPAIKDYIEQVLGIGDAAQKMREEFNNAFDALRKKAEEALGNIVSDKLGEDSDNIKKAIKGLEKVGHGLDTIAGRQVIIDVFLNDTDYTNKVKSLDEVYNEEYGDIALLSQEQGLDVGDKFITAAIDVLGEKGTLVGDQMSMIWEEIKASSDPTDTGNTLIGKLKVALERQDLITAAMQQGVQNPVASVLGLTDQKAQELMKNIPPNLAKELEAAKEPLTQAATISMYDPITNTIKQVPMGAETGLQPLPGIFNQAFLDASTQAGLQLAAIVVLVNTKMSVLSTSVKTYSDSMAVNWSTGITAMKDALPPLDTSVLNTQNILSTFSTTSSSSIQLFSNTSVIAFEDLDKKGFKMIQQASSDLSSTIKTHTDSMETNIKDFATKTITEMDTNANKKGYKVMQQASSDLSTSVKTHTDSMETNIADWAKKTIQAFKDTVTEAKKVVSAMGDIKKSVEAIPDTKTITIKYKVTGKPSGTQFGGSWIKGMQWGGSKIIDRPTRFDGVNMGEHYKPELVTVTPLTNPHITNDRSIDLSRIGLGNSAIDAVSKYMKMAGNKLTPVGSSFASAPRGTAAYSGSGGNGSQIPKIMLSADIHQTILLPDGSVYKNDLSKVLFKNVTGITSR